MKPILVFILLVAVYLFASWVPMERDSSSAVLSMGFGLFWLVGGAVTLAFLAFAGRKP